MQLAPELDATFAALADPTRRAILERLADGEATVLELAAPFAMTQPAITHHLAVLERAGLIVRGRDGRRRPCRLRVEALDAATAWMSAYRQRWEAAYARLDGLLAEMQRDPRGEPPRDPPTRGARRRRPTGR